VPSDLPIRCACGALKGVVGGVSAARGNRVVCYCDDCQSFAHFLGNAGQIVDAHGGTDIFQTSPALLEITEGADRLACVRLRPKGLLRWYAGCCRTPLANTPASPRLPFVGLICGGLAPTAEGEKVDEVLGPVRARVNARFARGDREGLDAHDRAPLGMMIRLMTKVALSRMRGEHQRTPFFDVTTGEPSALPRVLGEGELRDVEAARDAR